MTVSHPKLEDNRRADRLWSAVLDHDPSYDGTFVYAVRTTGVYCRPTCPSRRPHRVNVSFFHSPDQARVAGFRACQRCRPADSAPRNDGGEKVLAACRFIDQQEDRMPTLDELGAHVSLSPTHLQRVFKRIIGLSPRKYADAIRVERLKKQLQSGETIVGALYGTGYGSASRLYEAAPVQLGMTPRTYRRKGSGERIGYVTVKSPLGGYLLVAATARGICAVRLGDTARQLVEELKTEFGGAVLTRADDTLQHWLEALVGYLAGDRPIPNLPQDVRATAFQRRVWEAIRAVPEGTTATYSELAQAIGDTKAARAVARACARNPVALIVPCHRIVPKSGGTGAYRWGSQRKEKLLRLEKERGRCQGSCRLK